jgi:prophage antirepressor-like protein
MIRATCHTADNVHCIEFDATPWFSGADAPSIIDLAQRGWASTAIADSLERRRGYERLHDLVEYAAKRLQSESLEDPTWETFECVVDGPEAMAWLEKNRPDVVARIP